MSEYDSATATETYKKPGMEESTKLTKEEFEKKLKKYIGTEKMIGADSIPFEKYEEASIQAPQPARTKEECKRAVENYYNNIGNVDGNYCVFDEEIMESGQQYMFTVRYQMSDEEAQRRMEEGRMVAANTLVTVVTIDRETGKATDEDGTELKIW